MKSRISTIVIFLALMISMNLAAVPETINFQGALKDADGVPVNDTQFMEFRIYDDPDAGSLLWYEQNLTVEIVDGIFSEELGLFSQFPPGMLDIPELFITFFYGGEEMTPRQKLHSVPYALQAESANQIEDVPLSDLVQQDNGGNATITGTMTANNFAGNGSGLTGISGDNLGDHTAMENIQLDGHWLSHDGVSDGVYVASDSDVGIGLINPSEKLDVGGKVRADEGFTVNHASDDGIYVYHAGSPSIQYIDSGNSNGVEVSGAEGSGVFVGQADKDGVQVYNSGSPSSYSMSSANNGFEVAGAEGNGLYVGHADEDGVYVNEAINDGIFVYRAGTPTILSFSSDKNGFEVAGAEGNGLYVGQADVDGVKVFNAGIPSNEYTSTDKNGFEVAGAEGNGLCVGYADKDGVFVYKVGTPSSNLSDSDNNGFEVSGAEGNGLYVGRADLDGVVVNSASDHGVYINNTGLDGVHIYNAGMNGLKIESATYDGIRINNAGADGVWANTTDSSSEWGFRTNDKIYGSNITTRSQSTHVRYVGNEILESGDLVCIAGGYEEDVLGEDDDLPVVHVTKANSTNSEAVLGVVEYKVHIREDIEELEDGKAEIKKSLQFH